MSDAIPDRRRWSPAGRADRAGLATGSWIAGFVVLFSVAPAGCADSGTLRVPEVPDAGGALDIAASCTVLLEMPHNASVDDKITARAVVTSASKAASFQYVWRVTRAFEAGALVEERTDLNSRSFEADKSASYTVSVTAIRPPSLSNKEAESCSATDVVIVTRPGARNGVASLRITPSVPSGLPRQERLILVTEGTPVDSQQVALEAGVRLAGTLKDADGGQIPGVVRFRSEVGGLDVIAVAANNGRFDALLLPTLRYTPLLQPLDAGLPPRQAATEEGIKLATRQYALKVGTPVRGTVRDPDGRPIAGARVALRSGLLVGAVAITKEAGEFELRAEAGTHQLIVSAEGWPELTSPSLTVADGARFDVSYAVTRRAAVVRISTSSGVPLVGARVTLRRRAPLQGAATIAGVGAPTAMSGAVQLLTTTDPTGALDDVVLPAGEYEALLEPPAGVEDGLTRAVFTLAGDGSDVVALTLQPRVRLHGNVFAPDGTPVAGARVTAIERVGLGAAASTETGVNGAWSVSVDPGTDIELHVDVPTVDRWPRPWLPDRRVVRPSDPLPVKVDLKKGLLLGGVVRPPSGAPRGGDLVEVVCEACPSGTLGSTATAPDGSFVLVVPDPADAP